MGGQIRRELAWFGQRCGEERRGPGCGKFQEREQGLVRGERWASRSQIHGLGNQGPGGETLGDHSLGVALHIFVISTRFLW